MATENIHCIVDGNLWLIWEQRIDDQEDEDGGQEEDDHSDQ